MQYRWRLKPDVLWMSVSQRDVPTATKPIWTLDINPEILKSAGCDGLSLHRLWNKQLHAQHLYL